MILANKEWKTKKPKNESIQKKRKSKKKKFIWFFLLFLLPENLPEDRNSGIRSFTGPDGPGSTSQTTGRTRYSIYSPEKRPGQPEINFTGFLDTLVYFFLQSEKIFKESHNFIPSNFGGICKKEYQERIGEKLSQNGVWKMTERKWPFVLVSADLILVVCLDTAWIALAWKVEAS